MISPPIWSRTLCTGRFPSVAPHLSRSPLSTSEFCILFPVLSAGFFTTHAYLTLHTLAPCRITAYPHAFRDRAVLHPMQFCAPCHYVQGLLPRSQSQQGCSRRQLRRPEGAVSGAGVRRCAGAIPQQGAEAGGGGGRRGRGAGALLDAPAGRQPNLRRHGKYVAGDGVMVPRISHESGSGCLRIVFDC